MKDSKNNIALNYLYRDGGNYKIFGTAVFANPDDLSIAEVTLKIKERLIDEEYFYAEDWGIPSLIGDVFDYRTDPTWHELENIEHTKSYANMHLKINDFLDLISQNSLKI